MLVEKVIAIIERLQSLEGYDEYNSDFCYYELTELLGKNESETIECLMLLTEEQIDWIKGYFEEVSERLQSELFINALYKLEEKFPELDFKLDIECAKGNVYSSWCPKEENWRVRLLSDRIDRFLSGKGDFYFVHSFNEEIRSLKIKEFLNEDKTVSDEYFKNCTKEVKAKLREILDK